MDKDKETDIMICARLEKKDLVNMIRGGKMPYGGYGEWPDKMLTTFTGNQWNEDWEWNELALLELSDGELAELYRELNND